MVSFVFCLKQMTSYEMRISDWSQTCALPICCIVPGSHHWPICRMLTPRSWAHPEAGGRRFPAHSAWLQVTNRSEERRVGTECVWKGGSRWSPFESKKQPQQKMT